MLLELVQHALMITGFVFLMMLLIEYVNVLSHGKWQSILKTSRWGNYFLSALLGLIPGCLGAFAVVSLYAHRFVSLGALVAAMIATSGDEAFVMLVQFPGTALVLFGLLFVFGIIFAWISDKAVKILRITPCESCLDALCEDCETGLDNHEPVGNTWCGYSCLGP